MTVEKSVAGMERIVVPVSPLVRVGPLDVFVRRQIWRYQISVKSGQAQNAKNNKKKQIKTEGWNFGKLKCSIICRLKSFFSNKQLFIHSFNLG